MRLLVLSDSHGRSFSLYQALEEQPSARTVIFLGDGLRDLEEVQSTDTSRTYYAVKGNCDFDLVTPTFQVISLENHTVFLTHGHTYGVKYGTDQMLEAARNHGADIVLFGHTHVPITGYENGIYYMNPGSVSAPRNGSRATYGIVDVMPGGVMTSVVAL